MNRSDQINELAGALAKAQAEMKAAAKSGRNPQFKRADMPEGSKYAALPDVIEVAKVLGKNGLAFVQPARVEADGAVTVETVLMHSSGQWLSESLSLRPQQNTPQGIGSALTYGRRYGLSSLVGIAADEDDDGNAASAGNGHRKDDAPAAPSPESEALAEEFKQAMEAARDAATLEKTAATISKARTEKRITDGQAKALGPIYSARLKELKPEQVRQ